MERDRCGLIVLDRDACLLALSRGTLGCLALSDRALPLALPVSYVMDGETVVFRTSRDSTLARAASGSVVSFCAHGSAGTTGDSWSVIVTGLVATVRDPRALRRLALLPLPTWGTGTTPRVTLRLTPTFITGRQADPAASSLMVLRTGTSGASDEVAEARVDGEDLLDRSSPRRGGQRPE